MQVEETRALNHEHARLVAYAFHDPKKMPEHKPMKPRRRPETHTDADEVYVRHYLKQLSRKFH